MNNDDKDRHSSQLLNTDHISVSLPLFLCGLTRKWYSIIKPEGRGPNDSSDLSRTFCISSKAQLGMMSPNPTNTSPEDVRQRITTIQLGRYGQISLCDWIPWRERRLWVGCGDVLSICVCMCLRPSVCCEACTCLCVIVVCMPWQEVGATTEQCLCNVSDEWPTALPAQKSSLKSRMSFSVSNALRLEDAVWERESIYGVASCRKSWLN